MDLRLTFACGRYDRTQPLFDGRVKPQGVELEPQFVPPWVLFKRMLDEVPFDVAEFSLCHLAMLTALGDRRFVAIPAFTSRAFRHTAVYVSERSGITTPQQLQGARVGVPDYTITAAVYVRGFLQHDFGVAPESITWFWGGLDGPSQEPIRVPFEQPPGLRLQHVGDDNLERMLVEGDLDALVSAAVPTPFRAGDERVRRLFPDFRAREQDYYLRTGILPIMHAVVLRRDLAERQPDLPRRIFDAFSEAKAMAYADLEYLSALTTALYWLPAYIEEERALLGRDHWPYGVGENRRTLEGLLAYAREQHLLARPVAVEELFWPDLLAT
jgi:4,5-dihydroxyphthalate decarboxylase